MGWPDQDDRATLESSVDHGSLNPQYISIYLSAGIWNIENTTGIRGFLLAEESYPGLAYYNREVIVDTMRQDPMRNMYSTISRHGSYVTVRGRCTAAPSTIGVSAAKANTTL